jgi:hypothetical protein
MSPGDELVPDAGMVFDHATVLAARTSEILNGRETAPLPYGWYALSGSRG